NKNINEKTVTHCIIKWKRFPVNQHECGDQVLSVSEIIITNTQADTKATPRFWGFHPENQLFHCMLLQVWQNTNTCWKDWENSQKEKLVFTSKNSQTLTKPFLKT